MKDTFFKREIPEFIYRFVSFEICQLYLNF